MSKGLKRKYVYRLSVAKIKRTCTVSYLKMSYLNKMFPLIDRRAFFMNRINYDFLYFIKYTNI